MSSQAPVGYYLCEDGRLHYWTGNHWLPDKPVRNPRKRSWRWRIGMALLFGVFPFVLLWLVGGMLDSMMGDSMDWLFCEGTGGVCPGEKPTFTEALRINSLFLLLAVPGFVTFVVIDWLYRRG